MFTALRGGGPVGVAVFFWSRGFPPPLSYGVFSLSLFLSISRRNLWLLNAVYTHKTNTAVNLHLPFFYLCFIINATSINASYQRDETGPSHCAMRPNCVVTSFIVEWRKNSLNNQTIIIWIKSLICFWWKWTRKKYIIRIQYVIHVW